MGCGSSNAAVVSNEISPYTLEILKNETRFTEDEIKMWYEAFHDEHPDGEMNKAGFISLYSRLYPRGSVNDFSEHLFLAYDKDGSGKIDFREFMGTMDISQKGTSDEKLTWAFNLYDADKSGFITREEVTQIVAAIYKMQGVPDQGDSSHMSVEDSVNEIFKALEKDADGKLDDKEFIIGSKSNGQVRKVLESI